MKLIYAAIAFAIVSTGCSSGKKGDFEISPLKLKSSKQELSYLIGADLASQISKDPNGSQYNLEEISKGFHTEIDSKGKLDTTCLKDVRGMVGDMKQANQKVKFNEKYIEPGCNCIGRILATQFKDRWKQQNMLNDFDLTYVSYGFDLGLQKKDTLIKQEVKDKILMAFQERIGKIVNAEISKAKPKADMEQQKFFETVKKMDKTVLLKDGIYLQTLVAGTGASPKITDKVTVHYTLMNALGNVLETSTKNPSPITFPLSGVISGWQKGFPSMKIGGKYRLYVPYEEGYGESGNGSILPYSPLVFEIEFINCGADLK